MYLVNLFPAYNFWECVLFVNFNEQDRYVIE
jgi:hypothetical protein